MNTKIPLHTLTNISKQTSNGLAYLLSILLFSLTCLSIASCSEKDPITENYTIIFETNGGSTINPITVNKGTTTISIPANPTKPLHVFKGWYIDKGLVQTVTQAASNFDFSASPISKNTTLYAKWAKLLTITFDAKGGLLKNNVASISINIEAGNAVTKPEDPTKTGNTFNNWFLSNDRGVTLNTTPFNFSTILNSDTTLYASWTATATPPSTDVITSFTYAGHTYYIIKSAKSWTAAAAYAVSYGGYLMHINDLAEQNAIVTQLNANATAVGGTNPVDDGGGAKYLWIGATDKANEGTWIWNGDNNATNNTNLGAGQGAAGYGNWVSSSGVYENWGRVGTQQQEPDNYYNSQNSAAIAIGDWPNGQHYQWNDLSETNSLYFIMEVN